MVRVSCSCLIKYCRFQWFLSGYLGGLLSGRLGGRLSRLLISRLCRLHEGLHDGLSCLLTSLTCSVTTGQVVQVIVGKNDCWCIEVLHAFNLMIVVHHSTHAWRTCISTNWHWWTHHRLDQGTVPTISTTHHWLHLLLLASLKHLDEELVQQSYALC